MSADEWQSITAALNSISIHEASATAPGAVPSTPPTASSGTFNPDTMCANFIGTEQTRVCLKERMLYKDNCGTNHQGGRCNIGEDTLLIRSDKNTAYFQPNLPVSLVKGGHREVEDLLSIGDKTANDWSAAFAVYHQARNDSDVTRGIQHLNHPSPPATPWKETSGYSDNIIHDPNSEYMSFFTEETAASIEEQAGISAATMIHKLDIGMIGIHEDLNKVAAEANDYATVSEQNREKMATDILKVQASVGDPIVIDGKTFPTVWSALGYVSSKGAAESSMSPEVKETLEKAVLAAGEVQTLKSQLNQMTAYCSTMTTKLGELNDQMAAVDSRVRSSNTGGPSLRSTVSFAPSADYGTLSANYTLLVRKVDALAAVVNPNQIVIGGIPFDSEDDVAAWCLNHLPGGEFGCFLDVFTAYQMLATTVSPTLVEQMKTLALVDKLGLATIREASALTSMVSVIPTIFGGQTDVKYPLPKLKRYTDWNNGTSGDKKTQLEEGLQKVNAEVSAAIDNMTDPEARVVAQDCLTETLLFMSKERENLEKTHNDFKAHGYSSDSAWFLATTLEVAVLKHLSEG